MDGKSDSVLTATRCDAGRAVASAGEGDRAGARPTAAYPGAGALAVLADRFAAGLADEAGLHTVELVADCFGAYANHFHHAQESERLFARMNAARRQ